MVNFKTDVCVSTVPSAHYVVDQQVEMAKSIDDLMASQSFDERNFRDFEDA